MKKIILSAFAIFAFAAMNAQDFNVGAGVGFPVGDAGDYGTFNINLDVNALWDVSENFQAGAAAGLSWTFGDSVTVPLFPSGTAEIDRDDAVFLPIAGAGRFAVGEKFTLGADLGYAFALAPSFFDGGFYYAPKVQYAVSDKLEIVAAYRGVAVSGGSFDNVTVGVEWSL